VSGASQKLSNLLKKVDTPQLPLMRPVLPDADTLLPFLRRIDENRHYTNFGPLQAELIKKLLELQPRANNAALYGVCASSATAALELALAALNLPRGSRIGLPALTFIATASAIVRCGHVPTVFDVDLHDWMLKPAMLSEHHQSLAAVVPVATFGMPQDAHAWSLWSKSTGIPVIIDAAGAIGAQAIAPGVTAVFSLHATKPVSSGEGGFIVTEDAEFAERIRKMSNFGIGLSGDSLGTNAKLSEYHAAVGLASVASWDQHSRRRMALYKSYVAHLAKRCSGQVTFQHDCGQVAPCIFSVYLHSSEMRDAIEQECMAENIDTRRWYQPLIQRQPMLSGVEVPAPTPNATQLAQALLGLPFSLDMQESDVERVVRVIESAIFRLQDVG